MGLLSPLFHSPEAIVENQGLLDAMEKAAEKSSPKTLRAVHDALLESDLVIPTTQAVGNVKNRSWQRSERHLRVPMITVKNDAGEVAMLAFTDEAALKAWRPEGSAWIALRGPDVFGMALEARVDHVLINPAGPTGGMLDRRQIASLAEGLSEEPLGHQSFMKTASAHPSIAMRSPPDDVDPQLIKCVRAALASRPEVAAGYLVEMVIGQGVPHLGVGVEFSESMSPEAVHDAMTAILSQTQGAVPEGEFFDFVPLVREELRDLAREHGEPFFY